MFATTRLAVVIKSFLVLTALLALCPPTHAENVVLQSTISQVYPLSNGEFILVFPNGSACPISNHYFYVTPGQNGVTAEGVKLLFAASLTAAAQGKTVAIVFDNASAGCYINRLVVIF